MNPVDDVTIARANSERKVGWYFAAFFLFCSLGEAYNAFDAYQQYSKAVNTHLIISACSAIGAIFGVLAATLGNVTAALFADRLELVIGGRASIIMISDISMIYRPSWLGDDIVPTALVVTRTRQIYWLPSGGEWHELVGELSLLVTKSREH